MTKYFELTDDSGRDTTWELLKGQGMLHNYNEIMFLSAGAKYMDQSVIDSASGLMRKLTDEFFSHLQTGKKVAVVTGGTTGLMNDLPEMIMNDERLLDYEAGADYALLGVSPLYATECAHTKDYALHMWKDTGSSSLTHHILVKAPNWNPGTDPVSYEVDPWGTEVEEMYDSIIGLAAPGANVKVSTINGGPGVFAETRIPIMGKYDKFVLGNDISITADIYVDTYRVSQGLGLWLEWHQKPMQSRLKYRRLCLSPEDIISDFKGKGTYSELFMSRAEHDNFKSLAEMAEGKFINLDLYIRHKNLYSVKTLQ